MGMRKILSKSHLNDLLIRSHQAHNFPSKGNLTTKHVLSYTSFIPPTSLLSSLSWAQMHPFLLFMPARKHKRKLLATSKKPWGRSPLPYLTLHSSYFCIGARDGWEEKMVDLQKRLGWSLLESPWQLENRKKGVTDGTSTVFLIS